MLLRRRFAIVLAVATIVASVPADMHAGGAGDAVVVQPARPRGVQVMTMTGPWPDGGPIPAPYTQAGDERSPALQWTGAPEGTASFVLMVHDLTAASADGVENTLHWLVWNIPASATGLPEGVPAGASQSDGSRQISVSGPYYRGPGAPASGPAHLYVFELYALDTMLSVPAVGESSAATRAAVRAAMAGHVRAKAVYSGRYSRGSR
jgi:hypothetical protein